MKKKILISTGGSGGHVVPATILYQHLKDLNEVSVTCDNRGLKFLNQKDSTHLLFVDTDINFRSEDVFKMLERDKEVICGLYPKKYISKIKLDYIAKTNKQLPNNYESLCTDFSSEIFNDGEKAKYAATGFMLIKKEAILKIIEKFPNIVVIRTMSKAFAFAGARVGYLVSDQAVKDAMMIVRLPYHLSALTQAAAQVAIDHRAELLGGVSTLIAAREDLINALHQMGLQTVPSSANFILFTGFKQDAPQLWSALLEKGVLIRDVGLSGYLRVTIGNEAENNLFISALKELI